MKLDLYFVRELAWCLDVHLWLKLMRGSGVTLDDLRELERFAEFDHECNFMLDHRPESNELADGLIDDVVEALAEGTEEEQAVAVEFTLLGGRLGCFELERQAVGDCRLFVWGTTRRPDPSGWKYDPDALKLLAENQRLLQESLKRNQELERRRRAFIGQSK